MKKFYIQLWLVLMAVLFSQTAYSVNIEEGKRYQLQCIHWNSGSIVLGEKHQSSIPILYAPQEVSTEDSYWIFTSYGDKTYSIRNATTGQYLEYTSERIEGKVKGLTLSNTLSINSKWLLSDYENGTRIVSAADGKQCINIRTDGTMLVGTFTNLNAPSPNELFNITQGGSTNTMPSVSDKITNLTFNGIPAVYDNLYRTYLLPFPTSQRSANQYQATISFTKTNAQEQWTMKFDGTEVSNGSVIVFSAPIATTTHTITLEANGQVIAETKLNDSFLPIVKLTTNELINGKVYTPGGISVVDANAQVFEQQFTAKVRYRGATAQGKEKKAFAIKLVNDAQESVDASFFGLRSDNNWILDAMAVDMARMRNRVATDLWNDFSAAPYHKDFEPKAINATRGQFVEVILNGQYHGIYCMTEKVDRKQLKLKKFVTSADGTTTTLKGLLYKADNWHYNTFMGHHEVPVPYFETPPAGIFPGTPPDMYDNLADEWGGFEMSYPELSDNEEITWKPLYDAITVVANNDTKDFVNQAANLFDLPVALDYNLFIELLLGTDNHGKNMFYYVYDLTRSSKLGIAPWDLDGSWGRNWGGLNRYTANAEQNFINFLWKYEHGEHTLFKRLREAPSFNWESQLRARYAQLRETFFTVEKLNKRFTDYGNLFSESGADRREQRRWDGFDNYTINIPEEVTYITSWIPTRLAFLDRQFGYTAGIDANEIKGAFVAMGGTGVVHIQSSEQQTVTVYDLRGRVVKTASVNIGNTDVYLPKGIYIVGKQKIMVR